MRVLWIAILNLILLVGVVRYAPLDWLLALRPQPASSPATPASPPAPSASAKAQAHTRADTPDQPDDTGASDDQSNAGANAADDSADSPLGGNASASEPSEPAAADDDAPATHTDQPDTDQAAAARERELVATSNVNLRAGQGTEYGKYGKIKRGETVTVVDDPGGDWVRVEAGKLRGWAYRPLFKTPPAQ